LAPIPWCELRESFADATPLHSTRFYTAGSKNLFDRTKSSVSTTYPSTTTTTTINHEKKIVTTGVTFKATSAATATMALCLCSEIASDTEYDGKNQEGSKFTVATTSTTVTTKVSATQVDVKNEPFL
jgi:hypothetical protein